MLAVALSCGGNCEPTQVACLKFISGHGSFSFALVFSLANNVALATAAAAAGATSNRLPPFEDSSLENSH